MDLQTEATQIANWENDSVRFLLLLFLVLPRLLWAEGMVYKCQGPNGIEYQARPCEDKASLNSWATVTRDAPPPQPILKQQGLVTIIPMFAGNYHIAGSINGHPMIYMVDTGATTTTLSKRMANDAGIFGCDRTRIASTANGLVQQCMKVIPELTFGSYRVQNIEVSILPNMSDEALLGMNVLQHFNILQENRTLRLSPQ